MAAILPPGKVTFYNSNNVPLVLGTVDFYEPGTTTRKTTYQDIGLTIPNSNPVVLDTNGQAILWGSGAYRQVVKDSSGNLIWDQVTSALDGTGLAASGANSDITALLGLTSPIPGSDAPVKSASTTSPPSTPADGDRYIVPTGASGTWASQASKIAQWSQDKGAWYFAAPAQGTTIYVQDTNAWNTFNGTAWIASTVLRSSWFATIAAADTAASAIGAIILLDSSFTLAANTTLSAKWAGAGGIITRGTYTLTFSGSFSASQSSQCFDKTGIGLITFPAGTTIYPQWYGAVGDGTTDDAAPLQQAINSSGTSKVMLTAWFYTSSGLDVSNAWLDANDVQNCGIKSDATYVVTATNSHRIERLCIDGMRSATLNRFPSTSAATAGYLYAAYGTVTGTPAYLSGVSIGHLKFQNSGQCYTSVFVNLSNLDIEALEYNSCWGAATNFSGISGGRIGKLEARDTGSIGPITGRYGQVVGIFAETATSKAPAPWYDWTKLLPTANFEIGDISSIGNTDTCVYIHDYVPSSGTQVGVSNVRIGRIVSDLCGKDVFKAKDSVTNVQVGEIIASRFAQRCVSVEGSTNIKIDAVTGDTGGYNAIGDIVGTISTTSSTINSLGTSSTGNITTGSTSLWPHTGMVQVGSEYMYFSVVDGTTINIVTRGALNSTSATHSNGSTLTLITWWNKSNSSSGDGQSVQTQPVGINEQESAADTSVLSSNVSILSCAISSLRANPADGTYGYGCNLYNLTGAYLPNFKFRDIDGYGMRVAHTTKSEIFGSITDAGVLNGSTVNGTSVTVNAYLYFNNDESTGDSSYINMNVTLRNQSSTPTTAIPYGFRINGSGDNFRIRYDINPSDFGTAPYLISSTTTNVKVDRPQASPPNAVTYSASMTPNLALGLTQQITATNTTAFTINAPINPIVNQDWSLQLVNSSGGSLGTITFNAAFKATGFTAPANGKMRWYGFRYDGTNHILTWQGADQ